MAKGIVYTTRAASGARGEADGEDRAAFERNTAAFERLMATFDRHEKAFDRHEQAFDRHDLAMARHEKAMASHEEVMKRVIAALDRHLAREDEFKIFIRDQNLRAEKVVQQIIRDHEDFMSDLKANDSRAERRTDLLLARFEEVTKEQKAQRGALLRVIDRLPPPAEAV